MSLLKKFRRPPRHRQGSIKRLDILNDYWREQRNKEVPENSGHFCAGAKLRRNDGMKNESSFPNQWRFTLASAFLACRGKRRDNASGKAAYFLASIVYDFWQSDQFRAGPGKVSEIAGLVQGRRHSITTSDNCINIYQRYLDLKRNTKRHFQSWGNTDAVDPIWGFLEGNWFAQHNHFALQARSREADRVTELNRGKDLHEFLYEFITSQIDHVSFP